MKLTDPIVHYIKPSHRDEYEKMFLAIQIYCASYPYQVFGVYENTSLRQIQLIYHKLQQLFHPDVSAYPLVFSQKINKAYEMCRQGDIQKNIESSNETELDSFFTEIIKKIRRLIKLGKIDRETELKLDKWIINTTKILEEHKKNQEHSAEVISNVQHFIEESQRELLNKSSDKKPFKNQF